MSTRQCSGVATEQRMSIITPANHRSVIHVLSCQSYTHTSWLSQICFQSLRSTFVVNMWNSQLLYISPVPSTTTLHHPQNWYTHTLSCCNVLVSSVVFYHHQSWWKPHKRGWMRDPIPRAGFSSPGRDFAMGWRAGRSWRNQCCIICTHGDHEESHTKSGLFFSWMGGVGGRYVSGTPFWERSFLLSEGVWVANPSSNIA